MMNIAKRFAFFFAVLFTCFWLVGWLSFLCMFFMDRIVALLSFGCFDERGGPN